MAISKSLPILSASRDDDLPPSIPDTTRNYQEITTRNSVIYILALYRLLDEPDVTFEALMQPHWQQTRQQLQAHPVVLLVQDGTELDLSSHHQMTGLGPIGKGTTWGLLLQTMLAIEPVGRKVLGCAM